MATDSFLSHDCLAKCKKLNLATLPRFRQSSLSVLNEILVT